MLRSSKHTTPIQAINNNANVTPGNILLRQKYIGNAEFRNDTLEAVYHDDGRLTPTEEGGWQHEYVLRDHLGNTRATFADVDDNGAVDETEILQQNHYYPFGMNQEGAWGAPTNTTENRYQYNGKELNTDFGLNLNDYGARWYDAAIARWTSVDPLAEQYYAYSSYNYVLNNPVMFIDPDGRLVINGDETVRDNAKKELDAAQSSFNQKYNGNMDMQKADFENKSDYKEYKNARKSVNKAQKNFDSAQANFTRTQEAIKNFKEVDGKNFDIVNNLTYKNLAGEVHNLDVVVVTSYANEQGGGKTEFKVTQSGNIVGDKTFVKISASVSPTSNVWAHEFGHNFSIAQNPTKYYGRCIKCNAGVPN